MALAPNPGCAKHTEGSGERETSKDMLLTSEKDWRYLHRIIQFKASFLLEACINEPVNHLECVPFSSSKSPGVFGRTIFVERFRWFLAWINDMLLSWTILNYLILTSPHLVGHWRGVGSVKRGHPNCQEPGGGESHHHQMDICLPTSKKAFHHLLIM